MNKLVILGNGFDLAHGMKTRYSDFVLWYINEIFKRKDNLKDGDLIQINSNLSYKKFDKLSEVTDRYHKRNFEIIIKDPFFRKIYKRSYDKWVDIENEYFSSLLDELRYFFENEKYTVEVSDIKGIIDLNNSLTTIKNELKEYLLDLDKVNINKDIQNIFTQLSNEITKDKGEFLVLNFNYTSTVQMYLDLFKQPKQEINYIHGNLTDKKNPMIFGYGDESNKYFEKIENLNNNELTRHLKSFSYLTTSNYQKLFEFLGKDDFEVYVMGHSLGLSDRLLFNHIFEHDNFKKVQLYYYQFGEKDYENDFFQKTQELSRHFKLNSKHRMRTRIVPFDKSSPLTKFNPQN